MTVGGTGVRHAAVGSALGSLTLVVDGTGALAGLHLPGHRPAPPAPPGPLVPADDALVAPVAAAVDDYLAGRTPSVAVRVAEQRGTAFQRAVWEVVQGIAAGTTLTYGQVADAVGRPGGRRAVGAALAADHRCLAVPCHRVVGEGGAVTGFSGGVARKRWLLELEARGAPPGPLEHEDGGAVTDGA